MNKKPLTSFGQWQLVKLLGSGAFGEVHYWKNIETGHEIATKRLKANPKLKADEISVLKKRWMLEYKWLKNLRTNFIVGSIDIQDLNFVNYLKEQNNGDLSLPVIVMEYCNGGDLRGYLNKIHNINGLSEFEVRNILYAVLRATEYLHQECNIEHRDIKPDNIVIHIKGNEKAYKLTDFGYAREIPETTIAQSIVGTRNYVAPEVIDPGIYTKTVDYWSIGILAYEIICGIQPFIPHQTFVNRMTNIKRKPSHCIDIIQKLDDLNLEDFEFINNIQAQNHLSCLFLNQMETWLRLALDANYKTRGCSDNNKLEFYSYLDACLAQKIVTVFSLKTFKKYNYDIECFGNLQNFYNKICVDNNIDMLKIFFISPPLHPKTLPQYPEDYFVPEWCDTTNPDNPPVMLFVTEYLIERDCDINIEEHFKITETIKKCMGMSPEDNMDNIKWLLQQFERDVHFILSECQYILECYLMGLQNFSIEIDHHICTYSEVEMLVHRTSQLSGSLKHSNIVLNEYLTTQSEESAKLANSHAMFNAKFQELEKATVPQLKATYKEILENSQELAKSQIYQQYIKNDIFNLSKYRESLSYNHSSSKRLENTQSVFDKCIQEFIKFTQCSEMKNVRASLCEQIQKFGFLRRTVYDVGVIISRLENELENFTRSLIRNIMDDKLSVRTNSLHIDGPVPTNALLSSHYSLNDLEMDSKVLMDECQNLCSAMEMSLDIN